MGDGSPQYLVSGEVDWQADELFQLQPSPQMREVADYESMPPTPGRHDEEAAQVDEAPLPQMVRADQAESLQPQGCGGHHQPCRSHHAPGRRDEAVRLPAQAVLEPGRVTATRADVSTLTHELQRNIRHVDTLNSSIKELVLALGLHSNRVKVNSQNWAKSPTWN